MRRWFGYGSLVGSETWSPDSALGGSVCEAGGWRGRPSVEAARRRVRGRLGERASRGRGGEGDRSDEGGTTEMEREAQHR